MNGSTSKRADTLSQIPLFSYLTPGELEEGVQGAIRELSVYFRNKLPMRVAERFTWLFKHPRMMLAMASGGFKRQIAKPAESPL